MGMTLAIQACKCVLRDLEKMRGLVCGRGIAGCRGGDRRELLKPAFHDALAGRHLVKQQLGGLDKRIGMEPTLDHVIAEEIDDCKQRHALMVSHPFLR
jgi:hypothetical protein